MVSAGGTHYPGPGQPNGGTVSPGGTFHPNPGGQRGTVSPGGTFHPDPGEQPGTYTPGGTFQPGAVSPGGTFHPGQVSPGGTFHPGTVSPGGTFHPAPGVQPGTISPGGTFHPAPGAQRGTYSPGGTFHPAPDGQHGTYSPGGTFYPEDRRGTYSPGGTFYPAPEGQRGTFSPGGTFYPQEGTFSPGGTFYPSDPDGQDGIYSPGGTYYPKSDKIGSLRASLRNEFLKDINRMKEMEKEIMCAFEEIQKMLDAKFDKICVKDLKKFLCDKLKHFEEELDCLAKLASSEAAGSTTKNIRPVYCLSCGRNSFQKDREEMTVPLIKPCTPGKVIHQFICDPENERVNTNVCDYIDRAREEAIDTKQKMVRFCGGSHTVISPTEKIFRPGNFTLDYGAPPASDPLFFVAGTDGKMYRGGDAICTCSCRCPPALKKALEQDPEKKPLPCRKKRSSSRAIN